MDSDYLFGIFKLVVHIKSKERLAQAYATLAKLDNTLTSHLCFHDPKYLFLLLLTLSVPSEGYYRNAYMMWGFWCDCSLCLISKELLAIAVYIFFHYYHSHKIGE
jgi:hypothetical protein